MRENQEQYLFCCIMVVSKVIVANSVCRRTTSYEAERLPIRAVLLCCDSIFVHWGQVLQEQYSQKLLLLFASCIGAGRCCS